MVQSDNMADGQYRILTLEAFADTFVPGEKRSPDDRAIAGAAAGPGSVEAGAIALLETPATGVSYGLDDLVKALNAHAQAYATAHGLALDESVPAFVAMSYADRVGLIQTLIAPDHPEKDIWVLVALFCFMAFDTAAHLHTTEALAAGHPASDDGVAKPDADGL
jgi:hypothetical protein